MGAAECANMCYLPYEEPQMKMEAEDIGEDENTEIIARKGKPSSRIGYYIDENDLDNESKQRYARLHEQITKMMIYEKKKNKPLKVERLRRPGNEIKEPYYITSLDAIYIGEWGYHRKLQDNVPEGIGRLYSRNEMVEGELTTFIDADKNKNTFFMLMEAISSIEDGNVLDSRIFSTPKEVESPVKMYEPPGKKRNSVSKEDSAVQNFLSGTSSSESSVFFTGFKVLLDGIGRKITDKQEFTGKFVKGLLHGKGELKMKEEDYTFEGEWEMGEKHGRGVEKHGMTTYEGDFERDVKHGKGVLTFHLNAQYDRERLEDEAQVNLEMQNDDNVTAMEIKTQLMRKRVRENIVKKALEPFAWRMEIRSIPRIQTTIEVNLSTNKFERENNILKNKRLRKLKSNFVIEDNRQRKELELSLPSDSILVNDCNSIIFDDENFRIEHYFRTKFLEKYTGDFYDGLMHGKGSYVWYNGKTYIGEWEEGKLNGYGEFYWPDGVIYHGYYKNDKKHGQGEIIWCESKRFRGAWEEGFRQGYGELIEIIPEGLENYGLKITGGLWLVDKLRKVYFEKVVPLPGYQSDTLTNALERNNETSEMSYNEKSE